MTVQNINGYQPSISNQIFKNYRQKYSPCQKAYSLEEDLKNNKIVFNNNEYLGESKPDNRKNRKRSNQFSAPFIDLTKLNANLNIQGYDLSKGKLNDVELEDLFSAVKDPNKRGNQAWLNKNFTKTINKDLSVGLVSDKDRMLLLLHAVSNNTQYGKNNADVFSFLINEYINASSKPKKGNEKLLDSDKIRINLYKYLLLHVYLFLSISLKEKEIIIEKLLNRAKKDLGHNGFLKLQEEAMTSTNKVQHDINQLTSNTKNHLKTRDEVESQLKLDRDKLKKTYTKNNISGLSKEENTIYELETQVIREVNAIEDISYEKFHRLSEVEKVSLIRKQIADKLLLITNRTVILQSVANKNPNKTKIILAHQKLIQDLSHLLLKKLSSTKGISDVVKNLKSKNLFNYFFSPLGNYVYDMNKEVIHPNPDQIKYHKKGLVPHLSRLCKQEYGMQETEKPQKRKSVKLYSYNKPKPTAESGIGIEEYGMESNPLFGRKSPPDTFFKLNDKRDIFHQTIGQNQSHRDYINNQNNYNLIPPPSPIFPPIPHYPYSSEDYQIQSQSMYRNNFPDPDSFETLNFNPLNGVKPPKKEKMPFYFKPEAIGPVKYDLGKILEKRNKLKQDYKEKLEQREALYREMKLEFERHQRRKKFRKHVLPEVQLEWGKRYPDKFQEMVLDNIKPVGPINDYVAYINENEVKIETDDTSIYIQASQIHPLINPNIHMDPELFESEIRPKISSNGKKLDFSQVKTTLKKDWKVECLEEMEMMYRILNEKYFGDKQNNQDQWDKKDQEKVKNMLEVTGALLKRLDFASFYYFLEPMRSSLEILQNELKCRQNKSEYLKRNQNPEKVFSNKLKYMKFLFQGLEVMKENGNLTKLDILGVDERINELTKEVFLYERDNHFEHYKRELDIFKYLYHVYDKEAEKQEKEKNTNQDE